ncbi:MAG: HEAT repeat domain-containing protein [Pirellulales bacterium]
MTTTQTEITSTPSPAPADPASSAPKPALVDRAFEALKTYGDGSSRADVMPIDDAMVASAGDARLRESLESRLVQVLKSGASRTAKEYACRQLSLIGSATAAPALGELLPDKALSHMARFALERMACREACDALRGALSKTAGLEKAGVIQALGMRRDVDSLPLVAGVLADPDLQVAAEAAAALGNLGTVEAAAALEAFRPKAPEALRPKVADACLACAERLLAEGKKPEAVAIYKVLAASEQPKHVRLAATRGMLIAAGGK